ncbi:MAG: hypothetical protein CMH50_09580 [Myxococcales bacterium]|nr:hypothetical protein [Myxococcales bacterium]
MPKVMSTGFISLIPFVLLWTVPSLASTPGTAEGYIVALDKAEMVIDLGRNQGLKPGSKVRLYRRLVVTHPYTGKKIIDRFPIGEVAPEEVGSTLAIVRSWSGLKRAPAHGDIAVYFKPTAVPGAVAKRAPEVVDRGKLPADAAELQAIFRNNLGQSIDHRIKAYEAFVEQFPQSAYLDEIGTELKAMRGFQAAARTTKAVDVRPPRQATRKPKPKDLRGYAGTVGPIFPGEDLEVVVAVLHPEDLDEVFLFVSEGIAGSKDWTSVRMVRDGDYYYRAQLPKALTKNPATLAYFIEAVRKDAQTEAIRGRSDRPRLLRIQPRPAGDEAPGKTRVQGNWKSVNFNQGYSSEQEGAGAKAKDAFTHYEVGIMYEVNFRMLRAVRFGMGTIDGACTLDGVNECAATWSNEVTRSDERGLSLNYAFAEGELGLNPWVGIAARLSGGNHQGGAGNSAKRVTGFEGRLRVGELEKTRLVLGISQLDDLGSKGFLDVHIEVLTKVPLKAGVTVTSLPVQGSNWGVQLETQAGYRINSMFSVTGIVGWNARTINHTGFTYGGGLGMEW